MKKSKGSVYHTIQTIKEGLQSGVSMAGHDSLKDFINDKTEFVQVSGAGTREASTYAKG